METKVCNGPCGKEKNVDDFYQNKDGKIHSKCKECSKAYQAEYREKNKEKLKAKSKEHYEENKEVILERNRKYRENNIDKIREQSRESTKKRRSKIVERQNKLFAETPDNTIKLCSGPCGEEKPVIEFYKGSGKYGRRSQCIVCYSEKCSEYREENIEEVREQHRAYDREHREEKKEYYEQHKEEKLEYNKQYYEENKEEISQKAKEYREKNKEEIKAKKKKHYDENRKQILAQKREYHRNNPHIEINNRAKRLAATGNATITKDDWLAIMFSNNWRCYYCEVELTKDNRSVDHVIPLALGGAHHISNLVPSCIPCNSSKGDRELEEWDSFHKLAGSKQDHLRRIWANGDSKEK